MRVLPAFYIPLNSTDTGISTFGQARGDKNPNCPDDAEGEKVHSMSQSIKLLLRCCTMRKRLY